MKRMKRGRKYGKRMSSRFRKIRGAFMSVKRICYNTVQLTNFNTTSTNGFYQYRSVSLSSGFTDNSATPPVVCSLTNLSEYQALFDQYKLCAYRVKLIPKFKNITSNTEVVTTGGTTYETPYFAIVKDHCARPNTAITTWDRAGLNSLLEDNKAYIVRGDRPVSIYIKPRVQETTSNGSRYIKSPWFNLDTNGAAVPHYGFHLFAFNRSFNSASFGATCLYDVSVTYYLKLKNLR